MQPFTRGYFGPTDEEEVARIAKATGRPVAEVRKVFEDVVANDRVWLNDVYQVNIRDVKPAKGWPTMVHLSIKRRDKGPVGVEHFRDFQEIKNLLVGPEAEGVELYPAESRLADSANQYHLWVMTTKDVRFPFGFSDRFVLDLQGTNAKQRPFE